MLKKVSSTITLIHFVVFTACCSSLASTTAHELTTEADLEGDELSSSLVEEQAGDLFIPSWRVKASTSVFATSPSILGYAKEEVAARLQDFSYNNYGGKAAVEADYRYIDHLKFELQGLHKASYFSIKSSSFAEREKFAWLQYISEFEFRVGYYHEKIGAHLGVFQTNSFLAGTVWTEFPRTMISRSNHETGDLQFISNCYEEDSEKITAEDRTGTCKASASYLGSTRIVVGLVTGFKDIKLVNSFAKFDLIFKPKAMLKLGYSNFFDLQKKQLVTSNLQVEATLGFTTAVNYYYNGKAITVSLPIHLDYNLSFLHQKDLTVNQLADFYEPSFQARTGLKVLVKIKENSSLEVGYQLRFHLADPGWSILNSYPATASTRPLLEGEDPQDLTIETSKIAKLLPLYHSLRILFTVNL